MNRYIETIKELPIEDREFFEATRDIRESTALSILSSRKLRMQIEHIKEMNKRIDLGDVQGV